MIPIAILASGRGSNFDAILSAIREKRLDAEIVAVLSDKPGAPVLEKARNAGIPALLVAPDRESERSLEERRREHDIRVWETLASYSPCFLVMAGYMRVVTRELLEEFKAPRGYHRVVNIHPSLLPAFPGVDSYAQAFHYGVQTTGVTVHLVDEGVDSGPICAQEAFSISDCRTPLEVETRGLAIEHRLYPDALSWILPERFDVLRREERICVCPN